MTGAVIENLSNRKLTVVLAALLLLQAAFFFVGAYYAPQPTNAMEFELITCHDPSKGRGGHWTDKANCDVIQELAHFDASGSYDLREIVFIAQMPHVRGNIQLKYSSTFQFLLGLMAVEVEYNDHFKYVPGAKIEFEVRLGARQVENDAWLEIGTANATRNLECTISDHKKEEGNTYECNILDLFELPSVNYPFYLLNVRLPISQAACRYDPKSPNCQIGKVTKLSLIEIHQNGGFTLVWLWMKTIISPFVVAAVYWYWNRINQMARKPYLIERAILALGLSTAALDVPVEWLSLVVRFPLLLILSDIRQGLFYGVLFAFWLIFAGEHCIDDNERNNLKSYRLNLASIGIASLALLIYECFERGMQISDPFHSIWSSETGTQLAYLTLYLASLCTVAYFAFLLYKIFRAWTTIKSKRSAQIYRNCVNNRLKVEGIIYRFKFLMIFTIVCAAATIISYTMKQHGEAQMHDDVDGIMQHNTSSFFTGAFGMWNIYVLLLLAMYAPSHKQYSTTTQLIDEGEALMDNAVGTESTSMAVLTKPATD